MLNQEIEDILRDLNYTFKKANNYYQCAAFHRGGDNPTALAIYPEDNLVIDFVTGEKFSILKLISLSLNTDFNGAQKWIKDRNYVIQPIKEKEIKVVSSFFSYELDSLKRDISYGVKRGISEQTLRDFKCGVSTDGKMRGRFVIPIFNQIGKLVGITGRDITNKSVIKYKHVGPTSNWVFNSFLNGAEIQNKREIILVESPFCVMRLYDCGVRNVLCLFGLELKKGLLNYLLTIEPLRIILSTNNEESGRGNAAAEKIKNKLEKYFGKDKILIKLPTRKDFCLMNDDEIKIWKEKIQNEKSN